ncbi:MAG: sarcosine oxidase subunit [Beijerinckiaceae bacterium]|nr:MAG: sarcosine oxidase subunit [Beijerinckiaceae bacterium]
MSAFRTPAGGRIDRTKGISFTFDGRIMQGLAGDTLASALLANGVHLMGRSFKYHRPRGPISAGAEEPNALVTVSRGGGRSTPNLRATQVELYEGLVATSQNRWPSLALDIGEINALAAPFLGAGFYYKTFMGPKFLGSNKAWAKLYEPIIRRAAGLGRAPEGPDPDTYASRFAHCEVLVIGGGEAGLKAALEASDDPKARVILCDEQAEFGGWLLNGDGEWLSEALEQLRFRPNVRLLPRTQAFGYFAQNFVALQERLTDHLGTLPPKAPRERLWQVRAGAVVLATGAIERPIAFPDNDRPGIMLASAAEIYARRYGVKPGSRAVVFTTCNSAYGAALALKEAGVEVAAIVDARPKPDPALAANALGAGIPVHTATILVGTEGRLRVNRVRLGKLQSDCSVRETDPVACDLVLMAGGWTPSVHLFSQSRGKLDWNDTIEAYVPGATAPGQAVRSAGACAGDFPTEMLGTFSGASPVPGDPAKVKAFVDFQNDVTARDIRLATREGFRSVEHVKRFTTTGMATDQGKTSNMNALGIVADALGKSIPEVGLTTFRQPYTPVTFGLFAGQARGELFDPVRKTPIHEWAAAQGAAFEDVGQWKRAHYFARSGEDMHAAVNRECKLVRETVGLFDASTLGKIELVGPDAAELLDRLYVNSWKGLAVGRCRYGILLNEAGFVIDDGVIGRLEPVAQNWDPVLRSNRREKGGEAADRFHITTTTGGAARVFAMIEDYLQTEWPNLKVWQTSITEAYAVIAVQGPRARDTLRPLVEGIDLAPEAFPHMAVKTGRIAGIDARLFRVSFSGELGFEINVPAGQGRAVWEAVYAEALKHGGGAYGTEAMHVLRAEKGYIIVGQETDGTMTPEDVGLGWAIGKAKPDFVGKRGLMRPDLVAAGRKQLVGLATLDPKIVLEEGAQITDSPAPPAGTPALGHVTSAYWSETCNRSIALAVIANGRARMGESVYVPMPAGAIAATIVAPVFHDPKGERLNG